MAKILIAYASANGMTRECAERLARELNTASVSLCDLSQETPNDGEYDLLLIGSSIRRGKLLPSAREFLKTIAEKQDERPVGVFLCCGFPDRFEEYKERLIPKAIQQRAFLISDFGGTLNPARKPFWDKLWLFFARSSVVESEIEDGEYTPTLPGMIPESIGQMASFAKDQILKLAERNK